MSNYLNIKRLSRLIDDCNYADFFDEADTHIPVNEQNRYNELKNEFISGKTDSNYIHRLKIFLKSCVTDTRQLNILVISSKESD